MSQDMNLKSAEDIARLVPVATFETIETAGHGFTFYRPDEFVRLISDFKARLQTS